MQRVQVMLDSETHKKAKKAAKNKRISMSKLVRTVLEKELNGEYKIDVNATKVLRDATKKAYTGGPRDLSSNDDYLYKT